MNLVHIRSAAALFFLSLLTACGGSDIEAGTPPGAQSAAPVRAGTEAAIAPATQAATRDGVAVVAVAQAAQSGGPNPSPDCAAENCQGLRIIDGNAEAYRFDAMRRSTADALGAS
jgi:hypothetical protein